MTKINFPRWYTDFEKDYYRNWMSKVLEFGCVKCKGKIKQTGLWKLECTECGQKMKIDKKKTPRALLVDTSNPANWQSKCDECGGTMDYYNFRYMCRKCGNVLEV